MTEITIDFYFIFLYDNITTYKYLETVATYTRNYYGEN